MDLPKNLPPELRALMEALSGGNATIKLIPISTGSISEIDEAVSDFIEQEHAKHRETCPDCAAEYAEAQAKAKAAADKAAQSAAQSTGPLTGGVVTPAPAQGPARTPIGFMLFAPYGGAMRPVPGSFATDREEVEKKLEDFNAMPAVKVVLSIMQLVGRADDSAPEVRPVFGE